MITTSVLFQPAAFAGGAALALSNGGVRSILTVTGSCAVLPARSVAVPVTTWFAPSVLTGIGPEQLATPEPVAEQVNVTMTGVLFHPAALGDGAMLAVIMGGARSMLIVSATEAVLPAASVATTWMA